jgi:hypothetical protein
MFRFSQKGTIGELICLRMHVISLKLIQSKNKCTKEASLNFLMPKTVVESDHYIPYLMPSMQ